MVGTPNMFVQQFINSSDELKKKIIEYNSLIIQYQQLTVLINTKCNELQENNEFNKEFLSVFINLKGRGKLTQIFKRNEKFLEKEKLKIKNNQEN